jgi:large subunit ribosomal protein L19
MLSLKRFGTRAIHSTTPRPIATYIFSKEAVVSSCPSDPSAALRKGKGLIEHVRRELVPSEKREWLTTLFARNHPNRLLPGSVVSITQTHAPTNFTGILISLRRRGLDSSIILRNVVQRVGVEIQVFLGSPHLKEIKVLQRADGKSGSKRARRAKLYYLRDAPDKMSAISTNFKR